MLVVNLHTLQTVYVLNLVDDVFLNRSGTLDGEDVTRSDDTIGKRSTGTNGIVLLNKNLFGEADEIFLLVTGLACDDNLAVAALHLTHCHLTVDLRNHSGVARVARLEKLCHTRKTSGDVTSLAYGTRNLYECGTCPDGLSVFHYDVSAYREVVCAYHLTVLTDDVAGRNLGLVLRVGDDLLGQSGSLVGLGTIGDALYHIVEFKRTAVFGDDDRIERVPSGYEVAFLHECSVLEVEG